MFRELNELGEFVSRLDETDKPSTRIREYMQKKLPTNLGARAGLW